MCIVWLSIVLSSLTTMITSGEMEAAKWSGNALREMLLTPDGNGVDFEALMQAIEYIMKLDRSAKPTSEHLTYPTRPKKKRELPASSSPLALNEYLTVDNHKEATHLVGVSAACDLCASVVSTVSRILIKEEVWPKSMLTIRKLCYAHIFGPYSKQFCDGVVDGGEDIWFYVAPDLIHSPYSLCSKVLKGWCGTFDHPFHLWELPIPDPLPDPIPRPQPNDIAKEKYTVLYMTDLHIDPEYAPGSPARCYEPMCCRNTSTPKIDPVPEEAKAGYWGDYRWCDLPVWTFDDMLRDINETHGDEIDFVILNGDSSPHDIWNPNRKSQTDSNTAVFQMVADKISEKLPGKPVFFTVGNHDPAPINAYTFPEDPPQFSVQWLYDRVGDIWLRWLDPETEKTIKHAGYFTTLLKPGWRLISINNNYCDWQDFFLYRKDTNVTDPYGQLQWMIRVLLEAERTGEQVVILGHIQPGENDCTQPWSWNYYRIIDRFAHIISAQLFGHVHKDFFVLYYDAETLTKPTSVSFVGPPGTPFIMNNVAYRLYDFDSKNFTLLDYRQYYADIQAANRKGDKTKMDWEFQYSARESYSLPDMSAQSWHDFTMRMRKNATLHELYHYHYTINLGETDEPCTMECSHHSFCTIYHALSNVPASWCQRFLTPSPEDEKDRKCSNRFSNKLDMN